MKLYNTLTRKIETVTPITPSTVTVYTCGPTVYDYPHIGNWFTFVRYDMLIRALLLAGYQPKWVMNITDVGHLVSDGDSGEDKLEKGARREGKSAWDVATYYTAYFTKALADLSITAPTHMPKATDHIPEQIALIRQLEAKGFTYKIDDGIYFDTSKFKSYGKLARLNIEQLQAGARVELNVQKRHHSDFALWKLSPSHQHRDMQWESPWGIGFPGWHLECSAMAIKYLGETIDIHAGGIDHIPVHHTNEIAQTEGATDKPFAHYWMHTNHITINGQKISKSLSNGITLEDITAHGYSCDALRLHILESHYRTQSKFSWESLGDSNNALKNITANFSWVYQIATPKATTPYDLEAYFQKYTQEIITALTDDLNTPRAVAALHECAANFVSLPVSQNDVATVEAFAAFIKTAFGITVLDTYSPSAQQKTLLSAREQARVAKDWARSDALREQLSQQGLGVKDTPSGTIWYQL